MRRRPRRNHTPAFKAKVELAAIKGDRTLVWLAEHFDVQTGTSSLRLQPANAEILYCGCW
jgi:transposase-like protein